MQALPGYIISTKIATINRKWCSNSWANDYYTASPHLPRFHSSSSYQVGTYIASPFRYGSYALSNARACLGSMYVCS